MKNLKRNVKVNSNIETNKGITLVALVITIIILLILAGITLGFVFGKSGILEMAQKAGKNYTNAENEESNTLNDLYSSMLIATNDDAKITVSVEELRNIIKQEVSKELQGSINLENATLKPLIYTYNYKTPGTVGEYKMESFTRDESTNTTEYLEYNQEKNVYVVKKSGWYVIRIEVGISNCSNYGNNALDWYIGEVGYTTTACSQNGGTNVNSDSITLYIPQGTELYAVNRIFGPTVAQWINTKIWIYALGE